MDLIYANSNKEDVGVMDSFKFDLAYGFDENNFELSTGTNNHVCKEGFILYIEGTEYGGIIEGIRVETEENRIIYKGSTWHGLLDSKILEPDAGEDYLVLSGDANIVLASLIARMGLDDLFQVKDEASGLGISNYSMNRYIEGYTGIKKMLATVNGKLKFNFENGHVLLWAEPLIDYSMDDEFDSDQINFVIEKNFIPINHVICLGQGDLKERTVIHLYSDAAGNISKNQSFFGLEERTTTYENTNAGSAEELEKEGIEAFEEMLNSDSLQVSFDSTKDYDIGDIVGARENTTGIFMARPIIKKIINIENNKIKVQHKVGE